MTTPPADEAPTILVVAASPADLGSLPHALQREGWRVRVATMADTALAALAEGGISAALIDVAMRQRSGIELCKLIKSSDSTRHLPVFLMSHSFNLMEQQRSRECGACDYLARPLDAASVIEKIRLQLASGTSIQQRPLTESALHALQVNYHALLAHTPDPIVLIDLNTGLIVDANGKATGLFGTTDQGLLQRPLASLCPPLQEDGTESGSFIESIIERVLGGNVCIFDALFQHASGRQVHCELRLVLLPAQQRFMHVRIVDITQRRMDERLRAGQAELLEMVARGAALSDTLDKLALLIESQSAGVYCSVLLLDEDGRRMHPVSGPSLPAAYMASLDNIEIGHDGGSCGAAMYRGELVVVSDIAHDPLWARYKELVEGYGLRACWSSPIYLDRSQILGSFAMYYREVRAPDDNDIRLIGAAGHLAGIAIERTRREKELAQHRGHLEDLVAARTAELSQAKERTELVNQELAATLDTLRLTQAELVRRDKLAALGTLVTGVAHELNTPLGNSLVVATTMADRSSALKASLGAGLRRSTLDAYLSETQQANELLVRNLERAAGLVSSFKQIAVDHTASQRRVFSLTELLSELVPPLRIAARQRPAAPSVHVSIDDALEMDSYPGPLAQVVGQLFDNCLIHAFEHRAGGNVSIAACLQSPGMVSLSIADDGAGIPPSLLGRVYDPFFTTRLGSGGSGLGLHVTHNIVTGVLGGRIELESELGQGTRFTLLLPTLAPASSAAH